MPFAARKLIETERVLVSPLVLVELQYLIEIGRFTDSVDDVLRVLERDLGLRICDRPFEHVARRALLENWTRDPFDRLIVSQAALHEAPLVTRDRRIRRHYPRALWSDEATP